MDIFTTQIAQASRAVTTPIRPEKLKVKALVKDARLGKLKGDVRELDESDYAFYQAQDSNDEPQYPNQNAEEVVELSEQALALTKHGDDLSTNEAANITNSQVTKKSKSATEKVKHLDVFI
jgi:hypothetical protein